MLINVKPRKCLAFEVAIGLTIAALTACKEHGSGALAATGAGGAQASSPVVGTGSQTAGTAAPPAAAGASASPAQSTAGSSAPSAAAGSSTPLPAAGAGGAGSSAAGDSATGGSTANSAGAQSGGTGGDSAGAEAGAAGAGAAAAPPREDLGKGDGSDVVTIGDSWMNIATNGGGIEGGLDRLMTKYRHYAVAGTLLNGQIPGQYAQAKAVNPKISTVIMTGGGNDIMFSNACATKAGCAMAVQTIVDELNTLWTQMAMDGVKDAVYISYSKNAGTAPADTRPDTMATPAICLTGKITCHGINTDDLVKMGDTVDGIHPTLAGCDRIAKAVMDELTKSGARR
jgi:lysophospholipase L1-like esterase